MVSSDMTGSVVDATEQATATRAEPAVTFRLVQLFKVAADRPYAVRLQGDWLELRVAADGSKPARSPGPHDLRLHRRQITEARLTGPGWPRSGGVRMVGRLYLGRTDGKPLCLGIPTEEDLAIVEQHVVPWLGRAVVATAPASGRAKGRTYVHQACGKATEVSGSAFVDLCNPFEICMGTQCVACEEAFALDSFRWEDTAEPLPEYRRRLLRSAPTAHKLWCWVGAPVVGGAVGSVLFAAVLGADAVSISLGGAVGALALTCYGAAKFLVWFGARYHDVK